MRWNRCFIFVVLGAWSLSMAGTATAQSDGDNQVASPERLLRLARSHAEQAAADQPPPLPSGYPFDRRRDVPVTAVAASAPSNAASSTSSTPPRAAEAVGAATPLAAPSNGATAPAREPQPLFRGAPAQHGGQGENASSLGGWRWFGTTFGALAVVIGLILLLRAVMLRLSGRSVGGSIRGAVELLGRTPVGAKQHIVMLKVGPRVLVLADSAGTMSTICEITDPQEVSEILASVSAARPDSVTSSFSNLLGRFHGQYDEQNVAEEGLDHREFGMDKARESLLSLLSRVRGVGHSGRPS